jgi:hypothetical protein
MAGLLKPIGTRSEVNYKLWGYKMYDVAENGFNGSANTPYVGEKVGTYLRDDMDALYWMNDATNFLDIEVYDNCKIHVKANLTWGIQYTKRLSIYRNTNGIKGELVGRTINGYNADWNLIYSYLLKGRYRIELDMTDTAYSYHGDLEWFFESAGSVRTKLQNMLIGDIISCKYIATSGSVGTFSELGITSLPLISQMSSATPNGSFYFVHVGYDINGRMKLIADRNIQHSISWDTLNTKGIANGSGIMIDLGLGTSYNTSIRLLTGGTTTADLDNEWDKIIVESTLDGNITKGDNNVWNWSNLYSWTSTSLTSNNASRIKRGLGEYNNALASSISTGVGFRPVLLIEQLVTLNFLLLDNNEFKTILNGNLLTVGYMSDSLIEKENAFLNSGMKDLSQINNNIKNQTVDSLINIVLYKK